MGLYNGDEYWEFDEVDDLILFLCTKKWLVYAHNGGKFDYHFVLDFLNVGDRLKIINGRLSQFRIGLCEFRDSYNILPVPLAAYQKDKINYDIFEKDVRYKPENFKRIQSYLKSDCVYLYDLVAAFIGEFGLHLTQATSSLKYWQKQSGKKAPKSTKEYYDDIYPFYYGGRVQCFERGIIDRPFKMFDIRSAYPFAMIHNHPSNLSYSEFENPPISYLNDNYDHKFFEILAVSKGALPKRSKDGEITFPIDEMMPSIYHCTGHELRAAIETKTLQLFDIRRAIAHSEIDNFDEYIHHFYQLRFEAKADLKRFKEGTPEHADAQRRQLLYKLAMNSLYGKFAADPTNYANFWIGDDEQMQASFETDDGPKYSGILGTHTENILMSEELDDDEQVFYNVATSASITGFVRAFLWRHICSASGVLYCDTDSIGCTSGDFEMGNMLGQWECEGKFVGGGIAGKKLYAFEKQRGTFTKEDEKYKTASKGVRLTADEILQVCKGKTVTFQPKNPTYSVHKFPTFTERNIKMKA